MAELIIHGDQSTTLSEGQTTIGRAPDNRVVLDDPTISAYHAVIVRQESDFIVRDLNSSNGMKVNGVRVAEAKIADGDRLKLGAVECQIQLPVPEPFDSSLGNQRHSSRSSRGCPFCGSNDLKRTSAKALISISGDRLCRSCGAAWSPPVPKWAAALMFTILLGLTGLMIWLMLVGWRSADRSAKLNSELQKSLDDMASNPLLHVTEPGWKPPTRSRPTQVAKRDTEGTFSYIVTTVTLGVGAICCIPVLLGKAGKLKIHRVGKLQRR